MLGGVLLFFGTLIGVQNTGGLLSSIASYVVASTLYLAWFYLMTIQGHGGTIGEWLDDNPFAIGFCLVVPAILIWGRRADTQEIWKALLEDYSEVELWQSARKQFPVRPGTLLIDEERYAVDSIATQAGLLVARDNSDCLMFGWDRIESIHLADWRPHKANITIKRKTPLPLELQVPWDERFDTFVPGTVRILREVAPADEA